MSQRAEVKSGDRFGFGQNWVGFLQKFDADRLASAEESLKYMLQVESLEGKRFLDIGSGSGLFSLAARRLGAAVFSFDYDPESVFCTRELRARFYPDDDNWCVEEGSVLDNNFMEKLGQFDIVYSWGVLHHTGNIKKAMEYASDRVSIGGKLFVALYNDQGVVSKYWSTVKRAYNRNPVTRSLIIAIHWPYLFFLRWVFRGLWGKGVLERGMDIWSDMLDWLGGYPFEVAKPERVFCFYRERGFELRQLVTCGGRMGCNEFVFLRVNSNIDDSSSAPKEIS